LKSVLHDRECLELVNLIEKIFSDKKTFKFKDLSYKEIYSDFDDVRINSHLGNKQVSLGGKYFKDFDDASNGKILNIAKEISSSAKVKYFNINKISSEYGRPALPPHLDYQQGVSFLIDFQISSNYTWSKFIDSVPYDLRDGDALIFDPEDSVHWRQPRMPKPNEFIYLLCVYFEDDSEKEYSVIDRSKRYSEGVKNYKDQCSHEFGRPDLIDWNQFTVRDN
jgi:hypothetical protein